MSEQHATEIELILLLSLPQLRPGEIERMRALLHEPLDWAFVLGMLHIHRTAGIAWYTILQHAIQDRRTMKPAYFMKGLEIAFKGQAIMAREQILLNVALQQALEANGFPSALLKGSAIARMAYDAIGMRLFNDNDLLIDGRQLAAISAHLKDMGYIQGSWNYARASIDPAPRREILFMAVHSHQTRPYMKATPETDTLECHRLDVHVSLDLMSSNRTDEFVQAVLGRRVLLTDASGPPMWALHQEDMFLLLCIHFFKEAIHRNEVLKLKDLVLNKLIDVLMLLESSRYPLDHERLVQRIIDLGLEQPVCYTLSYLGALYPDRQPQALLDRLGAGADEYLHEVFDGKGIVHRWTDPIRERFFNIHRIREIST